jgi:hypothetical protein
MKAGPALIFIALAFLGLSARPKAPFFVPEPPKPALRLRKLSTKVTSMSTPQSLNALSLESLLQKRISRRKARRLGLFDFMKSDASKEKDEIKKQMARDRKLIGFYQPEHDLGQFLNGETTRIKTEISRIVDRFGDLDEQLEATMDEGYKSLMRMANG